MKLFLYSLNFTDKHSEAMSKLVGKQPAEIKMAMIENAADVDTHQPEQWVPEVRKSVTMHGYDAEVVDLRNWTADFDGLAAKLGSKDIIWVGGGNTYYLRWLLRETKADQIITELVQKGTIYAGWSAGAIVAGPTLEHIEHMEDRGPAPELVLQGLRLTDVVVVPHIDNPDFADAAKQTNQALLDAGFATAPLTDNQAMLIDQSVQEIIEG